MGQGDIKEIKKDIFGYHNSFNEYYSNGLDEILNLRLGNRKGVKALKAEYVLEGNKTDASSIVDQVIKAESSIVLVPYNIEGKHWTGLIFLKDSFNVAIKFIDPEVKEMPKLLKEELTDLFSKAGLEAVFMEVELEQQTANNCGAEVIEEFMHEVAGERVYQEDAVPYHSHLLAESLIIFDDEI